MSPQFPSYSVESASHATDAFFLGALPEPVLHPQQRGTGSFTLTVHVESSKIAALADTGADYNVIGLNKLPSGLHPRIASTSISLPDIVDAQSNPLSILGVLSAPFSFQLFDCEKQEYVDYLLAARTIVVTTCPYAVILGMPFFVHERFLLDPFTLSIRNDYHSHSNSCIAHSAPVSVAALPRHAITLRPLETVIVPLRLSAPVDPDLELHYLMSNSISDSLGVLSSDAVLDRRRPAITVTNISLVPVELDDTVSLGSVFSTLPRTLAMLPSNRSLSSYSIHKPSSAPRKLSPGLPPWCALMLLTTLAIGAQPGPPSSPQRTSSVPATYFTTAPGANNAQYPKVAASAPQLWRDRVSSLFAEFDDVFDGKFDTEWSCGQHHINIAPNTQPHKSRPYRLPEAHRVAMRELLQKYVRDGIIRSSNSPWSSPAFFVPKANGSLRFVVDYRILNLSTIANRWPLPTPDELFDKLHGSQLFSVFDALSGFTQQSLHPDSYALTAFVADHQLWEFLRMPMGLKNAPATFSESMLKMTKGLDGILVYLDDVNVYNGRPGQTEDDLYAEHYQRLHTFFKACQQSHLKLNGAKCSVFNMEVKYLGHIISREGIRPNPSKVEAVVSFKPLASVDDTRIFLGLVNYYRSFIPDCATLQLPLNALLLKDHSFEWTSACQEAFEALKLALSTCCVRGYPDPDLPFELYTDCSAYAMGAVLSQQVNGREVVVSYFSRSLSTHERNYPVFEKECLAIVAALKHYYHYLATGDFTVFTDHRSLATLFRWDLKDHHGRIPRWIAFLQSFSFTAVYKKGSTHCNADALSRLQSRYVSVPTSTLEKEFVKLTPSRSSLIPAGVDIRVPSPLFPSAAISPVVAPDAPPEDPIFPELAPGRALIGHSFVDDEVAYVLADVWYDAALQQIVGSRVPVANIHANPDVFEFQYFVDRIDTAAAPTPLYSFRPQEFRARVEAELPTLFTQEERLERVVSLPDDRGTQQYFRRYYCKKTRMDYYQLIIPTDDVRTQEILLNAAHDYAGHSKMQRTYQLLQQRVWWRGMQTQTLAYCRSCTRCAERGTTRDRQMNNHAVLRHPPVFAPFQRISLDLMSVKKSLAGNVHIICLVDHFSKWVECAAIPDKQPATIAQFILERVLLVHGVPETILTDGGGEFINELNAWLAAVVGVQWQKTTAYHPASNGQVERLNLVLQDMISKHCHDSNHGDWDTKLQACVFAYNTSVNSTTGYTPFFLLHGREARRLVDTEIPMPGRRCLKSYDEYAHQLLDTLRFAQDQARHNLDDAHSLYNRPPSVLRALQTLRKKAQGFHPLFAVDDLVMLYTPVLPTSPTKIHSRKLAKFWKGPYRITDVVNSVTFAIRNERTGKRSVVHANRLKRFYARDN